MKDRLGAMWHSITKIEWRLDAGGTAIESHVLRRLENLNNEL